jgi:hypothetical protein
LRNHLSVQRHAASCNISKELHDLYFPSSTKIISNKLGTGQGLLYLLPQGVWEKFGLEANLHVTTWSAEPGEEVVSFVQLCIPALTIPPPLLNPCLLAPFLPLPTPTHYTTITPAPAAQPQSKTHP